MKKRALMLSLVLALALSLAGCACEHEWTEADCLNASVCSKCEEVQGEALGHDWQAATCEAPETCSRCGETQGQALEHTYGQWEAADTTMTRTCSVCGEEDSADIDHEVILKQMLAGHWDFYAQIYNGQPLYAANVPYDFLPFWISFDEDGSGRYFDTETEHALTIEFAEFKPRKTEQDYDSYIFYSYMPDGSALLMSIDHSESPLITILVDTNSFILLLHEPRMEAAMTGTWNCDDNANCKLELREDRSFILHDETEITGTWHICAPYQAGGYRYSRLWLSYTRDGETIIEGTALELGSSDVDVEESLKEISFYVDLNEPNMRFHNW